jgi:kynurenine formamidase
MNAMAGRLRSPFVAAAVIAAAGLHPVGTPAADGPSRYIDHSLLVAPEYPCTWPSDPFPRFAIVHQRTIGPDSVFNVDTLLIDGNTGTQLDVPPHSVARPELGRDKSGPLGLATTDRIEPWQFGGEACVIDVRDLLDKAPPGTSPLVTPDRVERFERAHRPVGRGDVVLFRSGYSDRSYRPLPAGRRFIADVLDRKAPGYPDPDPDCMDLLGTRGVLAAGTDSASMGPLPDLAEPTHHAGLKYGMIWTEGATNLGELPDVGAFYCFLGPKHRDGPYGEGRAFSIVGGDLPRRLIDACRDKRAIDLSPTLSADRPLVSPGIGTGNHRQPYLRVDFLYSDYLDMWHHGHLMDAATGTHLVPPAYALPPPGAAPALAPEVRGWLEDYERRFGPRGTSTQTTEQVPIDQTCGAARVIDVRGLVGSTEPASWPRSPEITVAMIEAFEAARGPLRPGEIVILRTDHVDRHLAPSRTSPGMWSAPLAGKAEGWPAPGPEAIAHLARKGIRCVATDAPDLGGVEPKRAAHVYWALGSRGMAGIEFLVNVAAIPPRGAYFLFAAVKIRDCHAGPDRAIVLYDARGGDEGAGTVPGGR